jgi:hypothetical protein
MQCRTSVIWLHGVPKDAEMNVFSESQKNEKKVEKPPLSKQ